MLEQRNAEIAEHFDAIAPRYARLKARNAYYHAYLTRWCRALLPPGRKVVDFGCGDGNVLAAVAPSEGIGIDLSPAMIAGARESHPGLHFACVAIEEFDGSAEADAVLMINTMEYVYDIGEVLEKARATLRANGRLFITTANPIWSPIFKLASRLGLRIPECRRLFVTNEDLVNLLQLHGFEVRDKRMTLIMPKYIPLISAPLNWLIAYIPYLRVLSSTQLIMARKVPSKRTDYSVSVVIPCHNEVENVDRCVTETPRLGNSTEIIFVDDGSTDGTADAVRPELNPDVAIRVLRQEQSGKGAAVKHGMDAARGDIVLILDADLTTHPEELQPLYDAFATGRAEFVNCTRLVYPMEDGAMRFANYVGNKLFTLLVSWVMEDRVSDTLCGTKAMYRWDYEHMRMGRDPWGDYDFLFGAAQLRLALRELPVHYRERTGGVSKMNSTKHTLNLLRMCALGFGQVKLLRPLRRLTH